MEGSEGSRAATRSTARWAGGGRIASPRASEFSGILTGGLAPPPTLDLLDAEIRTGNVPRCAMNVWRNGDLGALYSRQPEQPCGCFFELTATGRAPDTCVPCDTSARCPSSTPVCRRGFCEVL